MKTFLAIAVGALPLLVSTSASAQSGNMMNGGGRGSGWMDGYGAMGGYNAAWVPTLLVIAVVALVVWVITQKRK
jgi:uncharacterized membrane protein